LTACADTLYLDYKRRVWAGEETRLSGKASSLTDQPHAFAWRDLYDIPIRWRQFSEVGKPILLNKDCVGVSSADDVPTCSLQPNDPVWWVDLLSPEQFAEGYAWLTLTLALTCQLTAGVRFGSHTPMVTGQTYVVRYSPMAPRAIKIMKEQLEQSPLVPQSLRHKLTRTDCTHLRSCFANVCARTARTKPTVT
jgi:hypothetical protein